MEMKLLFLSFVVGLGVGALYGLIRVKSPAPPIVALLGLLGMVLGEQLGVWIQTKKLDVPRAAAVCLVGERYDRAEVRTGAPGSPNLSRLAVERTWAENDGTKSLERF
jgi:XapX domain-containing protein